MSSIETAIRVLRDEADAILSLIDKLDNNFELNEEEMKQISSLDMGYSGSRVKHFEPDFVRMVLNNKIHD